MAEKKGSLGAFLGKWMNRIKTWMKPDPADHIVLRVIKFFFKIIAMLVLIALSPVILVLLVFVFFAAF